MGSDRFEHCAGVDIQSSHGDGVAAKAERSVQNCFEFGARVDAETCCFCLDKFQDKPDQLTEFGGSELSNVLDYAPGNDVRVDPGIAEAGVVNGDDVVASTEQKTVAPDEQYRAEEDDSNIHKDQYEHGRGGLSEGDEQTDQRHDCGACDLAQHAEAGIARDDRS